MLHRVRPGRVLAFYPLYLTILLKKRTIVVIIKKMEKLRLETKYTDKRTNAHDALHEEVVNDIQVTSI